MSGEVCMFVHHKVRQSTLFWGNLVILAGLSSWGTAQNLEDCIREAFWRNPAYQAARRRVDVAHFEWAETHSAYLPELTLKSSYVRTDRPSEVFLAQLNRDDMHPWCGDGRELSDIEKMGNLRVSVEAGLCLYDGGLRGALRRRTHLGVRLATECARNILNDVVLRVTCEYYNVLRLRSLLDDYTSDLLTLEEVMDLARQPLREPVTSDSVTGELDAILAMKRERISRTRRELSLAVAALNAAIGGTVVTDHKAVPLLSPNLPSAPPAEPDSAVLLDHAEYRIVQINARMCEESYRHTSPIRWPKIRAFGSYDQEGGEFDNLNGSYTVGVMAEWNLFPGFAGTKRRRQVEAQRLAATHEVIDVYNRLKLNLIRAHLKSVEAWERAIESGRSVVPLEQRRQHLLKEFKQNTNLSRVMTAQAEWLSGREQLARAVCDYFCAIALLEHASGTLANRYLVEQRGAPQHSEYEEHNTPADP